MNIEERFLPPCQRGQAWAERAETDTITDDASPWGGTYDRMAEACGAYWICPDCLPYFWRGTYKAEDELPTFPTRPHPGCATVPRTTKHNWKGYTT